MQTTADYGDMKSQNVATLIERELINLSDDAILRYVPSLSQIWAISGTVALMFDLVTQSWYKRQFNSKILDVLSIGDEVLIIKPDRVSKLEEETFFDSDKALTWHLQCKRRISHYNYFLKHTAVSFTPLDETLSKGQVRAGAVVVDLPIFNYNGERRQFIFSRGERIFNNYELIYDNPQPIFNRPTIIAENRNVYRSKFLDITGRGTAGGMILNSITLDVVEV